MTRGQWSSVHRGLPGPSKGSVQPQLCPPPGCRGPSGEAAPGTAARAACGADSQPTTGSLPGPGKPRGPPPSGRLAAQEPGGCLWRVSRQIGASIWPQYQPERVLLPQGDGAPLLLTLPPWLPSASPLTGAGRPLWFITRMGASRAAASPSGEPGVRGGLMQGTESMKYRIAPSFWHGQSPRGLPKSQEEKNFIPSCRWEH